MASRLQDKRRLKAVILNFLISGVSYLLLILDLIAGLFPYSKLARFVNISAQTPLNYWIMIVGLFLIGTVFLGLALWSVKRYRSYIGSYQ